jgi:large conductance mechanosensitive channel
MSEGRGRKSIASLIEDVQGFVQQSDLVELARVVIFLGVALVFGKAVSHVILSFVEDVALPLVRPLFDVFGPGWREMIVSGIKIGSFLGSLVDFLIISVVLFVIVQVLRLMSR